MYIVGTESMNETVDSASEHVHEHNGGVIRLLQKNTNLQAYTCGYKCVIYIYIHTHAHTNTHTNTHTHTRPHKK